MERRWRQWQWIFFWLGVVLLTTLQGSMLLRTVKAPQLAGALRPSATNLVQPRRTSAATPMIPIVDHVQLANTYYYRYQGNLTKAARRNFAAAVVTYNRTGIVHLIPGKAPAHSNQITFSSYHKAMPLNTDYVELGRGGPTIIQQWQWWHLKSWNHATASLNGDYSAANRPTAAIHELGHALGLSHSKVRDSAMYPYQQNHPQLSASDRLGLQAVYHQSGYGMTSGLTTLK